MKKYIIAYIALILMAMFFFACNKHETKRTLPDVATAPKEMLQSLPDGTTIVIDTMMTKLDTVFQGPLKQPNIHKL